MRVSKVHAENLLASLLWLVMAGCAVSSCVATGLRTVTPSNAPPDISHLMATDTPAHRGISIGGHGYLGHEIVAPADGVVVLITDGKRSGNHVRIHHGLDTNKRDIYTEHFHVHGQFVKEGHKVKRGHTIGVIEETGTRIRLLNLHYHYVVLYREESPRKYIPLDPNDYWFGIDQYKEKQEKGLDVGRFVIFCFDANVNYPKEPIRFTYPIKCK
jgi:murein DD-endopeptidase MepM/ murein hydrolase activator NlpD